MNWSDTQPITPSLLTQIMSDTRQAAEQRKQEVPLAGVRALASMQSRPLDLSSLLRQHGKVGLIAQIKRSGPDMASPVEGYDPLALAARFQSTGALALAVATNEKYYHGGIADLTLVSQSVQIPVIRQDFIYDEYQIVEARAAGADAVVLIASLLPPDHLRNLISSIQRNRMTEILQVQSDDELKQILEYEPRVIAITNRDMHTFEVNLSNTPRLRDMIPPHMAVISMGGLRTAEDVAYVSQANIHAVVVGQALLTAPNAQEAVRDLLSLTTAS